MKKASFRARLLGTLIPIAVMTIGALSILYYRVAYDGIMHQQEANMQGVVRNAVDELATWISER
ncbi:MAG: hypothetical protein HQK57_06280 [Deltaproteobacteria bacterium]|nr:hypothetical protein [Deltaproteobacteria bacterium]